MSPLPSSLPRVPDFKDFGADPLDFLERARNLYGELFVIREDGPILSREPDCAGVIAAFGAAHQRAVLSAMESFGMPESAARRMNLPHQLINLNRSLHSMRADQHALHKRLLSDTLSASVVTLSNPAIWALLGDFVKRWAAKSETGLLGQMRELVFQVSSRVMFGDGQANHSRLARSLQSYFHLRRETSSPASARDPASLDQLVMAGHSLDAGLRAYVRECRLQPRLEQPVPGVLSRIATLEVEPEKLLSEDEVLGHSNIFFVSSTEPVAVALTWILLVLSQLPRLRNELRNELNSQLDPECSPESHQLDRLTLLDHVIKETLRLLPPNALMVRLTTRPTPLQGVRLPARCEVLLCPFLAHRDQERFPQPRLFLPDRWKAAAPSRFEYFPFGAGGHSCIGRGLANYLIKMALVFLLPRCDVVLAEDQEIDWRVHIQFMPRTDPVVRIHLAGTADLLTAGKLRGPVRKLLEFDGQEA